MAFLFLAINNLRYSTSQVLNCCPSSSQSTALAADTVPNSPLCTDPWPASCTRLGLRNSLHVHLSDHSAQLYSVGANCAFNIVSFLAGQLHTGSLPNMFQGPLLKSLSVAHPMQYQVTVQFSTHTTYIKSQKFFMVIASCNTPPPDSGVDSDPFGRYSSSLSLALSWLAFGTVAMLLVVCV